jgi:hypothetical protein
MDNKFNAPLLAALKAVQVKINDGTIVDKHYGLCLAILLELKAQGLAHRDAMHVYLHVSEHMLEWPDSTGLPSFPIPSSYKHITAAEQYYSTHNKWGGKQLQYRKALLAWLIEQHGG